MNDLLDRLNPPQREAVTAGAGPVLVQAGPGSGKTRVLTHRIAYLIREMNVYPSHIVAVTFTNKAAAEMRARVEKLLDASTGGMQIGTFHSICARLLRIEADATPYSRDYVIFDTDDQLSLMKRVLAEMQLSATDLKKYSPYRVLNAISGAKNELIEPAAYTSFGRDYFSELVARVYPRYQALLRENNAMDFDDLLMQTVIMLRDNEAVRRKYQERLDYVLVDEFQDTNQAQYQLVKLMAAPQHNVFVVGDEDQGIYAFRGADYRNVDQFRRDYPAARVILLEQNYRSTQIVLDAARAVIDRNNNRTPKALFTDRKGGALITIHEAYSEDEEGEYVAKQVMKLMRDEGYRYNDFAVMYRTNAQSRALEDAMIKHGIPYKLVGGVGFYKRREIRDLIAYLRIIHNGSDSVSFARVVNVPGRGIGQKSVETFQKWASDRGETVGAALEAMLRGEKSPVSGRAAHSLAEFALLIAQWREIGQRGDLVELFDEIVTRTGYMIYLNEISDTTEQMEDRTQNVQELRGLISDRKDLSLGDLLNEMSLVADADSAESDRDTVTLLTLHAAKGLEFSAVFMPGVEDGLLPHERSLTEPSEMAEERRLMYVGITRAKDHLFLSYAFRRSLYGESKPSIPSRFLGDIPAELMQGAPAKVHNVRDRVGYQQATRWERSDDEQYSRAQSGTGTGGKILQFPTGVDTGNRTRAKSDASSGIFGGPAVPRQPPLRYQPGMQVQHSKYGEGTVLESARSGNDEEVRVNFPQFGVKTLSAEFANLKIVRGD